MDAETLGADVADDADEILARFPGPVTLHALADLMTQWRARTMAPR